MIRTSLLLGVLLAGTALPAAAQGTIRPGQTVRGELSSSDPVLEDGTHYDLWRFRGQAGHVYAVTLRSQDFDAYLAVGSSAGDHCEDCESDDDEGGGTDARVELRAGENGTYEIRANSLMEGETGAYTVELEDLGEREQRPESGAGATPIRPGMAVQGELTENDAQAEDESYFDLYVYEGRADEAVTISLSSEAFDTFLAVGRLVDGEFELLDSNDDGPSGTDSVLRFTFPEDGEYVIRANSLMGGDTGAYTLQLTRG
ncbi:PPC domain-containing protein [Longimicrobium sp.]|uniref:PPC domain-containing protein n=1 Tax=Longimicrobium sp. TaxID=2029185 RepID=UPI003B3B192C